MKRQRYVNYDLGRDLRWWSFEYLSYKLRLEGATRWILGELLYRGFRVCDLLPFKRTKEEIVKSFEQLIIKAWAAIGQDYLRPTVPKPSRGLYLP